MSLVCEQEVVQRLFDDQEDQQDPKATDKEPETPAEQPCPAQATTVRSELMPHRDREETKCLAFIDLKTKCEAVRLFLSPSFRPNPTVKKR